MGRHEGSFEDSFWQHKRVNHSISLHFCLVLCSNDINLYIWNVVQILSTLFWIAKKFKYLNTVVLKYILINWRKPLCLCCQNATLWLGVCVIYLTVTPSFSRTRVPFSWYSSLVIQKLSLSFMMSASTAPPKNTMCLRRGGSSMRILNFYKSRSEDIFSKTAMLYNAWNYYYYNSKLNYSRIRNRQCCWTYYFRFMYICN